MGFFFQLSFARLSVLLTRGGMWSKRWPRERGLQLDGEICTQPEGAKAGAPKSDKRHIGTAFLLLSHRLRPHSRSNLQTSSKQHEVTASNLFYIGHHATYVATVFEHV